MQNTTVAQAQSYNLHARNELITAHIGMAMKMARKMARRLPRSVLRDDVESAALLGLTEAASRYDADRQEPFMAFAAKRVRGAILDHLRKNDILSRRARQGARQVTELTRDLEVKLGRVPSDSEIASAMGMTETKFHETYDNLRGAAVVQLDDLRSELTDPGASGTSNADKQRLKSALMQALKVLDEREQIVLACYYGDGLTLREIGAILEVSESRVCQLHTQALAALRNCLG